MTVNPKLKPLLAELAKAYPDAKCALDFKNPFELIVATVLSAQCTDVRVNMVTPELFKAYPDARAMAGAPLAKLERLIRSTGFYRAKALSLHKLSIGLVEQHGGKVPANLDDLIKLRGVGRKTANVVLGNAFGIPGITVDTHLGRLARRMGMTPEADPVKVERDLMEIVPKKEWTKFSHRMIAHGRAICAARKPLCEKCPVQAFCPKVGVVNKPDR